MRLTKTKEWEYLIEAAKKIKQGNVQIIELMKEKDRLKDTTYQLDDFYIDLSKNLISADIRNELNNLAKTMQVEEVAKKMVAGEKINITEKRAVLHTALRNITFTKKNGFKAISSILFEEKDIMPEVVDTLNRMAVFTEKVRNGKWKGANGNKINTIVNIGIGGSDLGVKMITRALNPYKNEKLEFHFVSNVDGTDIVENLRGLDPAKTMFIIASKTFTTQETMTNAETAKRWFLKKMKEKDVAKHFVAASTAEKLVKEFGIDTDNMFPFWDWVGGRYSSPSAIGLPVMLAIGAENYGKLLAGYNLMDTHFLSTPVEKNIPMQLALTGIWYNNFLGAETTAILAYDQSLEFFAQYFQQADMESNGKSVNIFGEAVDYNTGPIVWGEPGTNGQHAFYQLIHQGTKLIPADFIAFAESHNKISDHHEKLMSNFFAQTKALMLGISAEELKKQNCPQELIPFKTFTGNKPTNSILIKKLTPKTLGMLIAMYEHKIFTQGVIWQINSFDQYGVELGKILAKDILLNIKEEKIDAKNNDASTATLLGKYFRMRQ